MNFETELAQIGNQYRGEGYEVTLRPRGDQLPSFAQGWTPELLAVKNGERVLVQVKETAEDLRKDPTSPRMAEVVRENPGWRFDLIVLNKNVEREKLVEGA